ncbi:MAG: CBS domain-containing protein [Acidimicrobiales bacterium]
MEIGPLVSRAVLTVEASDSLTDAAVWMIERGVGSAVVMDGSTPTGVVTDRDALRVVAKGAAGSSLTVGDCMTRLTSVSASLGLLDAARIMRDKGFRHLVVVGDEGGLVGVFSMRDLVLGLLQEISATAAGEPSSMDQSKMDDAIGDGPLDPER